MPQACVYFAIYLTLFYYFIGICCSLPTAESSNNNGGNGGGQKPYWTKQERELKRLHVDLTGNTVRFRCPVDGNPTPRVDWFKDGEIIIKDSRIGGFKYRNNGQIIILDAVVPADGGLYMCKASNKYGSINHTYELAVKEHAAAPVITANSVFNQTVDVGDNATFKCKVISDARPHMEWIKSWKDGNVTKVKLLRASFFNTTSYIGSLLLKNVSLEDAGEYTCLVGNAIGISHQSAWLKVLPGQKPWWTNKRRMKKALYAENTGSSVRFRCQVGGYPEPQIEWFKDGNIISSNNRTNPHKYRHNKQTVILDDLTLSDAGMYRCKATNIYGSLSFTYELQIHESLTSWQPSFITIIEGEDVRLRCKIYNGSHPLFIWTKGDKNANSVSFPVTDSPATEYIQDVLLIRSATQQDTGRYTCITGSNFHDLIYQSYWIRVIPSTHLRTMVAQRNRRWSVKHHTERRHGFKSHLMH